MLRALLLLCCLIVAPMARAHPHVFVDVGLAFHADDQGALTQIEVTWRYDTLFSLLVLSDRGLDPDGDMALTEAERAMLLGFDLTDWESGFNGALFLTHQGADVALGPPEAISIGLEDGHLVTRHMRPLKTPLVAGDLVLRPYDPSYYAALSLTGEVVPPAGCKDSIIPPDKQAADAQVEALGGFANESTFEEVLVGRYYADTLILSCARS